MARLPVTVAVSFESERTWHWTCTRDLDRYFLPDGSFDVRRFFRENPCLTDPGSYAQDGPVDPSCGWHIRWYGNVWSIDRLRRGWEAEIGYKSTLPASSIFFVEGGAYVFRHTESGLTERVYLDRRGSRSGAVNIRFSRIENEAVTVHAYPSKAFREDFIRNMFEHVDRIFPGAAEDPLGASKEGRKGQRILPEGIRAILCEFAAIGPKPRRTDQLAHVRIDQFDATEHRITDETEYAIMSNPEAQRSPARDAWQKIPVEIASYEFSTPENEYLLYVFESLLEIEKTSETENLVRLWRKHRIRPSGHSPVPRKLLQNRNAKTLIEYLHGKRKPSAPAMPEGNARQKTGIERTNQLFEHYALIRLAESLERIGTVFPHGYGRGLYDAESRRILPCEKDGGTEGRLEWFYEWHLVRLSYVPRFTEKGKTAVLANQAESLRHFSSAFGTTGRGGLTPDYSIEWNGGLIVLDAKFSAFREMDERFDYPCPEYVTEDLQKYRKIWSVENGIFVPHQAPIFLIYPGSIEDERDLVTLRQWNGMLTASYRICLLPFGNHSESIAKSLHAYLDGLLSQAMHENRASNG